MSLGDLSRLRSRPDSGDIYNRFLEIVEIVSTGALSSTNSWKGTVRAATVAPISLSGLQTIDGVALVEGDRVLVKNQSPATSNGLYVVSSGDWTRAEDADSPEDMPRGFVVGVREGSTNNLSFWVMTAASPITLGVTNLTFGPFSSGGGGGGTLAGDVNGPSGANTVDALQGVPLDVVPSGPSVVGFPLVYTGTEVRSSRITSTAGDVTGELPDAATVARLQGYELNLGTWTPTEGQALVWTGIGGWTGESVGFDAAESVRADAIYGEVAGVPDNLSKPYQTLQGAFDANTRNILISSPFIESPSITNTNFAVRGESRFTTTWSGNGSAACDLPAGATAKFENITLLGVGAACVQALNGADVKANNCIFTGNGAFGLTASTLTLDGCRLEDGGGESQFNDVDARFTDTYVATGSPLRIQSNFDAYTVTFERCTVEGSITVIGTYGVEVDAATTVSLLNLRDWSDAFGAQTLQFHGRCENDLLLRVVNGATVDAQGCSVGGTLSFRDYTGQFNSCSFQGAVLNIVETEASSIGPITIDLSYASIRGPITIENEVTLILTHAEYDPNAITLIGTGRYIDAAAERVRVPPTVTDAAAYDVQPCDGLIPCDNLAGPCTVRLGPAAESAGQIVVAALQDPAVTNVVTIEANGSDTIEGAATYAMDDASKRRISLIADPATSTWIIADVYPGAAAPASPLAFPSEVGTTYNLSASESGVIMLNPSPRQVTLPAASVDGTTYTVVDGAGTASTASIEVVPAASAIIGVLGSDFITSDFASVTYRYSATAGAWSRV